MKINRKPFHFTRKNAAAALVFCAVFLFSACSGAAEPRDITAELESANAAFESQDYSGAYEAYKKACEGDAANVDAARGLARTLNILAEAEPDKYAEEAFEAYKKYYGLRGFEENDFDILASMYTQKGDITTARDLLEQAQRLYPQPGRLDTICAIVTDVEGENEDIKAVVNEFCTLVNGGDTAGAVALLSSESCLNTLAPKIYEGFRNYTYTDLTYTAQVKIKAGYLTPSAKSAAVWYTPQSGNTLYFKVSADEALCAELTVSGGQYNGAFSTKYAEVKSGSVFCENGSFTADIPTGEIVSQVYFNDEETDLNDLWSRLDALDYEEYTGEFSSDGSPKAKQQSAAENAGGAVYAYNSGNTKFIYAAAPQGAVTGDVFDCRWFGIEKYPEW